MKIKAGGSGRERKTLGLAHHTITWVAFGGLTIKAGKKEEKG